MSSKEMALLWPSNDNARPPIPFGRSLFPQGATARISAIRSPVRKGRTQAWRLTFERQSPPRIEPLMGWLATDDTLSQVELRFPTKEAALSYAERQGIQHVIVGDDPPWPPAAPKSGELVQWEIPWLEESYGSGCAVVQERAA